ncbi:acetyltransferase [Veronia pacifica]|uniref:Acetyltransferase n=1 Tax=Veronia pacifica TaxID=1080227 RepID=A0A1C3ELP4_9GAMM|nr:acetyltransferase [Veronia pacifica]ODA34158.1 acetyltransferase [Veronia pacifica]
MARNRFDVFNGDADGICALIQLRLDQPAETTIISGVKRDIALLKKVPDTTAADITVLDVSMAKNRDAMMTQLELGSHITYVDHHDPGEIPDHPSLTHHINTASNTCTSLIVDKLLNGAHREWALVGAYGDNMISSANALLRKSGLSPEQGERLTQLGNYVNYNGYGASEPDLHFNPVSLYQAMVPYRSPFDFIQARPDIYQALEQGYIDDNAKAAATEIYSKQPGSRAYILPDQAWSRRVSGVFSNQLTNQEPTLAHAVLTERADGDYLVSIRAPLKNRTGANELASAFPTGGGRQAAAGINALPASQLSTFLDAFHRRYAAKPI